ncbi:SDR family oxidoreductase [Chryseobacterium sp. WLY505]|uniref:SDR family oxidoreductase n=1 Tax=Chryseobacterium sp. WLY505 TaxID=3068892 RepID=UPI0027964145|nr:SDR family oxidoreductase [Chryseobacterium sp. WLY505]MDQ1858291.1 SDR family oxidoreductase [Chryseobacterium sp. WLY505]
MDKYKNLTNLLINASIVFPENKSIKDSKQAFTYEELYDRSMLVAKSISKKIKRGDRIICMTEKNVESIVLFWGILFSGAIPVLIDNDDQETLTKEKINYLSPSFIAFVSKSSCKDKNIENLSPVHFYDELILPQPNVKYEPVVPADICYMLLTSGTTGEPKAVQISHQNVLHYITSVYADIGSPKEINTAHVTTFAADLGLTNFLIALISGGCMRIFDRFDSRDPNKFLSIIKEDNIQFLKSTPSHILSIINGQTTSFENTVLDFLVLGGEKLTWNNVDLIFGCNLCNSFYNHYGPTETTIGATLYKIDQYSDIRTCSDSVPIGFPIGENKCSLSGGENEGELVISGPGVSLGYFGVENIAKNEEKFQSNGIVKTYKTGDYCKIMPDGSFEFLYRMDRQVKIRGYRVELGEIELSLLSHPEINYVFVDLYKKEENTWLEAYLNTADNKQLDVNELKAWLQNRISSYKIPSRFFFFEEVISNKNGKIDTRKIKSMFKNDTTYFDGLKLSTEQDWESVVEIAWKKTLMIDKIQPLDDFFALGANSIQAIKLIGNIQRQGFNVTVNELYENSNFCNFLNLNKSKVIQKRASIAKNEQTLSQRLFLKKKFDLDAYCQTVLFETSDLKLREFGLAVKIAVSSHELLTRCFNSGPYHQNDKDLGLTFSFLDKEKATSVQIFDKSEELIGNISLEEGRTFLTHVFLDDASGIDYVFFAAHHIVIDVTSWQILFEEILDIYDNLLKGIKPNIPQENLINDFYGDLKKKAKKIHSKSESHFEKKYHEDKQIPYEGFKSFNMTFSEEFGYNLLQFEKRNPNISIDNYLFHAFTTALFTELNEDKICVDVEFHGRPRSNEFVDISRSVGWWANSIPLELEKEDFSLSKCIEILTEKGKQSHQMNIDLTSQEDKESWARFNYLGRFPETFDGEYIRFKPSAFNLASTRTKQAHGEYLLNFTLRFIGNRLLVDVQTVSNNFYVNLSKNLLRRFAEKLNNCFKFDEIQVSEKLITSFSENNVHSVGKPFLYTDPHFDGDQDFTSSVLLTGGTGYLGANLLFQLLDAGFEKIYVLVRGKDREEIKDRFYNSIEEHGLDAHSKLLRNKVILIEGDISMDLLGLSERVYLSLANEVRIVYHTAANINLSEKYEVLKASNVDGTRRIIDFCKKGQDKHLHYVSTIAVCGYVQGQKMISFSETDLEVGQKFRSNYERTKYEAEHLVRIYAEENGHVKIYRMGHIAANSVTGKFQRNYGANRIMQILRGIMEMKKVPRSYNEKFSFSYVDVIVKSIVGITATVKENAHCFHLESPHYFEVHKIVNILIDFGYEIEIVDDSVYYDSLKLFEDNESVTLMANWIQRYFDSNSNINILSSVTNDKLANLGLYFKKPDAKWIKKIVQDGINAGYLQSPEKQLI